MTNPHPRHNHQPCEHVDAHLIHELVEALAGLHLEAAQHLLWHSHLAGLDPGLYLALFRFEKCQVAWFSSVGLVTRVLLFPNMSGVS